MHNLHHTFCSSNNSTCTICTTPSSLLCILWIYCYITPTTKYKENVPNYVCHLISLPFELLIPWYFTFIKIHKRTSADEISMSECTSIFYSVRSSYLGIKEEVRLRKRDICRVTRLHSCRRYVLARRHVRACRLAPLHWNCQLFEDR
jgi:hypothetical protein